VGNFLDGGGSRSRGPSKCKQLALTETYILLQKVSNSSEVWVITTLKRTKEGYVATVRAST
jgi:hypothetical protein